MGKKDKKDKQKRAQAKKARKAEARRRRHSAPAGPGPERTRAPHLPDARLAPPRPERLAAPVYVDAKGEVVPDPWALLGLSPGAIDEATVRTAWLAATRASPPERDPDGARRAREARDRLVDPERWLERELGVLRAPDADAWGLADTPPGAAGGRLDAEGRLAAAAVLYALVEDAIEEG